MDKEEYDFYAESEVLERQRETMDFVKYMEEMRKNNRICLILLVLFVLFAIAGCIMLGMVYLEYVTGPMSILWLIAALTLIFFSIIGSIIVWGKTFFYEYKQTYKNKLVKHVLDEMFENVYYSAQEGLLHREVRDMKLINDTETFYSEDFVEGDYKGCHFAMAECWTCMNSTLDTNMNITTFIGKIFDLDYNKSISSDVYIYGDNFIHPNKEQINNKKIKLESIDFGRHFHVYASDDETAFYVLMPQLQEALLELGELFHYDFAVAISGQRMYVAVTDYRNTLEAPDYKKKIDYLTECSRIRQDMSIVTSLLEALPGRKTEDKLIRHSVPEKKDTVVIYEESGIDARTRAVIELFIIWLVLVLVIIWKVLNSLAG